jgi:hypothetical protein
MSSVGDIKATYRHKLVNAITGASPRECYRVHDATALDNMLTKFVECEQVTSILRHKGYGDFGMSLADVANLIPEKAKA